MIGTFYGLGGRAEVVCHGWFGHEHRQQIGGRGDTLESLGIPAHRAARVDPVEALRVG